MVVNVRSMGRTSPSETDRKPSPSSARILMTSISEIITTRSTAMRSISIRALLRVSGAASKRSHTSPLNMLTR